MPKESAKPKTTEKPKEPVKPPPAAPRVIHHQEEPGETRTIYVPMRKP